MRAQSGRTYWCVSLWLAGGMALSAAGLDANVDGVRFSLRAASPHAQWLIDEGRRRSPTIAWLAGEITASDLIVHVIAEPLVGLAGRTVFQVQAGGYRYVTVVICTRQTRTVQLATLAHELVHALEIADAPEVRTQADVKALYDRIGERTLGLARYETNAARKVGERALSEVLSGRHRPVDTGALARLVRPGSTHTRAFRRNPS